MNGFPGEILALSKLLLFMCSIAFRPFTSSKHSYQHVEPLSLVCLSSRTERRTITPSPRSRNLEHSSFADNHFVNSSLPRQLVTTFDKEITLMKDA